MNLGMALPFLGFGALACGRPNAPAPAVSLPPAQVAREAHWRSGCYLGCAQDDSMFHKRVERALADVP
jgi:hypothetical protein